MRGSALVTMVLETIATNIASSRPLSASSTSRCVMAPGTGAAGASRSGAGGGVGLRHGFSAHVRSKGCQQQLYSRMVEIETVDPPLRPARAEGHGDG